MLVIATIATVAVVMIVANAADAEPFLFCDQLEDAQKLFYDAWRRWRKA